MDGHRDLTTARRSRAWSVLVKMIARASAELALRRRVRLLRRHVLRHRPDGLGVAAGRDIVLDRDRHAVERTDWLPLRPAGFGRPRLLQRALRA